jgi:hypothetical protein
MTRRDLPIVIAISTAVAFSSRSAEAAPSARLVYARGPGAEGCPDEHALREAIAARVGYDPFFPWAPLTISVEVSAVGGHLRGRIIVETANIEKGSQTIDGTRGPNGSAASCEDLLGSIALAVSVVLDVDKAKAAVAPEEPREEPPASPPETGPAPASAPAPDVQREDKPKALAPIVAIPEHRAQKLSLWIAPGARASFGTWPSVGIAPDLFAELRYERRFGLGAEGRVDFYPATVSVGEGEHASIVRATGSVLPCAHFGWFSPCALATFGETWAHGVNVAGPTTASGSYVAFGGRVGAEVGLMPRLRLLGTLDVVGIVTPIKVEVGTGGSGTNEIASRPVDASLGVALLVSIF